MRSSRIRIIEWVNVFIPNTSLPAAPTITPLTYEFIIKHNMELKEDGYIVQSVVWKNRIW